jgi:hypothetical protein
MDMVDAWVKKHYGDLERGVLAPEVKYKVLFKIYRKKLKEKKVQVRMLRRLLQGKKEIESWGSYSNSCCSCEYYIPMHPSEGLTVIPASCSLGKSMTACCPFYSVKGDEIKVQKEMNEEDKVQKEMKTCDKCKYSTFKTVTNGREAATGKLWCTKNDFYASGVMTCDWFEDKEKAQSSYLDWMHDDITWCCRECSNMDCERNSRNRRCKEGLYSVADMYDPFRCPVDAELPKQP